MKILFLGKVYCDMLLRITIIITVIITPTGTRHTDVEVLHLSPQILIITLMAMSNRAAHLFPSSSRNRCFLFIYDLCVDCSVFYQLNHKYTGLNGENPVVLIGLFTTFCWLVFYSAFFSPFHLSQLILTTLDPDCRT